MEPFARQLMIKALAQDLPPYVPTYDNFEPGKSQVLYSGPYWDNREVELALEAFLHGHWLTTGEYTVRFQNNFAKRFNAKYAHMVNSGSSANLVMLAAAKKTYGWDDGDEIIVSPVGFPTTIAPIVQCGLTPVFVDIELDTLNFDVRQIRSKITERTRAIFVSPVLGNPPDMDALVDICKGTNVGRGEILLLGDNCDSLGTRWNGQLINELYVAWTTSFFPAHHITTGEGGMVCGADEQFMKTAKSITWWGRDCYCVGQANALPCGTCKMRFSKWLESEGVDLVIDHKFFFTNMGYNLKPLDLQGAIGLAQLEKLNEIEAKRRAHKATLSTFFSGPRITVAQQLPKADPCWFGVPLICDSAETKTSMVAHLEANKIQTRSYFAGNILKHPAYKHLDSATAYPLANEALSRVFFIGCPPHYNAAVLGYIGEVVAKWQ